MFGGSGWSNDGHDVVKDIFNFDLYECVWEREATKLSTSCFL